MPDSASGAYTRPASPIPVTGQGADAPQVNIPVDDMAAALNRRHFSDGRKSFTGNQNFNGYKAVGAANATDPQDYVTLAQVAELISQSFSVGVPTGAMVPMTGMQIPSGFLGPAGQLIDRETYADLWAFAQESGNLAATQGAKTKGQFGPGDGSTTFSIPDLRGDFIRALPASGRTIGSSQANAIKSHGHSAAFSGNAVPAHNHDYPTSNSTGNSGAPARGSGSNGSNPTSSDGGHTPTGTVSITAFGDTETRPDNIAFPWIIKT